MSGLGIAPAEYDEDWTDTKDEDLWRFLCEQRNELMKKARLAGEPVQFKSKGRNLERLVFSGDTCYLWPITPYTSIEPGDIVFAEVQPKGYLLHPPGPARRHIQRP